MRDQPLQHWRHALGKHQQVTDVRGHVLAVAAVQVDTKDQLAAEMHGQESHGAGSGMAERREEGLVGNVGA